jgi:Ca-activated chloride channel family protein
VASKNSWHVTVFILILTCLVTLPRAESDESDTRPTFRVGVETVFINVAVTDSLNRYIGGLDKESFRIFEDTVEQSITHFVEESAPVSLGILFDISASMKRNIQSARRSVLRFLQFGTPDDEFFLVSFNQKTTLVQGFTRQAASLERSISSIKPRGRTALYDAVHLGMEEIRVAKNRKSALILITDGEDNSSRYTVAEVRDLASESGAPIYAIGEKGKLGYGYQEIQGLADLTGGRAFFPQTFSQLDYYVDLIRSELTHQYVLGYTPVNKARDGKWRKLQVKLAAPEDFLKMIVRTRQGYFASKE